MYNGSYVTGFSNFLMGAAALFAASQTQACFEAGTPIRTPEGWKAIEELKVGEWVLSRSDKDTEGEVRARRVVQTFLRYADVVDVLVGGKTIGTTAEHPFYVQGQGWRAAGELKEGDLLSGEEGWEICGGMRETGRHLKVYNVQVEEDHTYFVGGEEWGFSVWAHNADCTITKESGKYIVRDQAGRPLEDPFMSAEEARGWAQGNGYTIADYTGNLPILKPQWTNETIEQANPLSIDPSGKVHNDLPPRVPNSWTPEEIQSSASALEESIKTRQQESVDIGEDANHSQRIQQELTFLRQLLSQIPGS